MNFRSYSDLTALVGRNLWRLPHDIDLVVHVPRSGIIPAAQIVLQRNLPFLSLDEYLARAGDGAGFSARKRRGADGTGRVVVVDDGVDGGDALAQVCVENWAPYRPAMNRLDQQTTHARGLRRRAGRALRRRLRR